MNTDSAILREIVNYEPVPLKFGTSGRWGLVCDLTQLEVYINAVAELEYLQSLPKSEGGIVRGEDFYFACDLRPSSTGVVNERGVHGGIAQAIVQAIADSSMKPVFLGRIPTPALASYAFSQGKGSMMVTGSHIPFDRNGYKTNSSQGELLKRDEAPIQARSERVRAQLCNQPANESPFNEAGMFRDKRELPPEVSEAFEAYLSRYKDFFAGQTLHGIRMLVYQHSAVGRDLLVELLRRFGAKVIPAGRSESFVPIDTEAIDAEQLRFIESPAVDAWKKFGPLDSVISTDGDSDRPLILGVEPVSCADAPCQVQFFGGDLVGMVLAEFLQADAVVVPVSCNDALERGELKNVVEPKTRIGSPCVIAGMQKARARGKKSVCGWEANGGFLLGSSLVRAGRTLEALPTRDAFLPVLAVQLRAQAEKIPVSELFDHLPRRFSKASLLRNFPRASSLRILAKFSPRNGEVENVSFDGNTDPTVEKIQEELESFFTAGEFQPHRAFELHRWRADLFYQQQGGAFASSRQRRRIAHLRRGRHGITGRRDRPAGRGRTGRHFAADGGDGHLNS
ncbi:MAG TPA: phosphomannomutase [Candidatus Saccharimonadales bacterium]|nr:phosphomannomutase [Candidatus Saccharimonadales bacterium]